MEKRGEKEKFDFSWRSVHVFHIRTAVLVAPLALEEPLDERRVAQALHRPRRAVLDFIFPADDGECFLLALERRCRLQHVAAAEVEDPVGCVDELRVYAGRPEREQTDLRWRGRIFRS